MTPQKSGDATPKHPGLTPMGERPLVKEAKMCKILSDNIRSRIIIINIRQEYEEILV